MDKEIRAAILLLMELCDGDVMVLGNTITMESPLVAAFCTDDAINGLEKVRSILEAWLELRENQVEE